MTIGYTSGLIKRTKSLEEENIYLRHFYENKPTKIVNSSEIKKDRITWLAFPVSTSIRRVCKIEWVNPKTKEVEGFEIPERMR